MGRLTLPTYVILLIAFGLLPDCVLSVTTAITAFTDNKRLVAFVQLENSTKQECLLHTDGGKPLPINEAHVTRVKSAKLDEYLKNCTKVRLWPVEHKRRRKRMTYPGTKWCGVGNEADTPLQLGSEREVDSCCRKHDHCTVYILPFHQKFGLYNFSFFTVSDCSCDREFKHCLEDEQDSRAGQLIYNMYFKFLRLKCIEEKMKKVCVKSWFFTCSRYELKSKMEFSSP